MLQVLLTILKIIGIILLCILGSILVLLFIILFVPVRYKAFGSYKDRIPNVKVRISYLLYLFCFVIFYKEKLDYYVRLIGIKIRLSSRSKKKKQVTKTGEESSSEDEKEESDSEDKNASDDEKKDSLIQRLSSKKENISNIIDILTRDTTKEALLVCKDRIGRALKAILPKRGRIYARIGLSNAGTTGKILGVYKALYDYIGDVVTFYPVFDSEVIDIEFDLKGHIRAITVLYHLLRIYFDKNCNRLIRLFIKKGKKSKANRKEQV